MKRKLTRDHSRQPRLKIIKTVWRNTAVRVSFVVVDLNSGQEYPQNFVCMFPRKMFKANQRGNLRRSRFFHVFGEKTHETARNLLEDALKREADAEVRMQIEASLKDVEVSQSGT